MATRTNATADGVILDPAAFARHATIARPACHPALDPWVEHYWTVTWQLPVGASYRSSLVPASQANLTVEAGGSRRPGADGPGVYVTGVVSTQRFDVALTGVGSVVGVKFRPGALTVLTGVDASRLRDRVLPAADLMSRTDELADLRPDNIGMTERLDAFLLPLTQSSDASQLDAIAAAVAVLEDSEPAMSATDLADRCGMTLRSLQRLTRQYIGVGPQWLVARARVHAAVARLHSGDFGTLAELAVELGWFDQAHMGRDFSALIGESPGAYRARVGGGRSG